MKKNPSRISIFFAELKRRKVIRLATLYAVIGLGVIEAIDVIGGRLLIPDGLIQVVIIIVLAGFPFTMVGGWIFDITSKGIERTETLTPEEQSSLAPLSWRPGWITIISFIIIIALTGAFFTVPRPNSLGFKSRDWIIIADLQNNTGDSIFDRSLIHALTVTIDQSRYVNIYPRNRIMEALKRMQLDNTDIIDIPLALEVAERENIKAVLALTISEISGTYVLITELINPYTGTTVRSRQEKAEGKDDILPALDHLASVARRDLGESLRKIFARDIPLPMATTHSLEALKLYSDGAVAWSQSRWIEAQSLWERAVELDSGFAWANASVGFALSWVGREKESEVYLKRSLSQLDRVTEKERLWITALATTGNESVEAYHTFLQQYPDERDGWYNLGNALRIVDRTEEAMEAYKHSLSIDPVQAWPHVNIGVIYDFMGQPENAAYHFNRSFEIDPSGILNWRGDVNRISGFVLVKIGDTIQARKRFETLLKGEENARANGLRSLALLDMYHGRYSSAVDLLEEAAALCRRCNSPLSEFRNRMYLARALQTMHKQDELLRVIEQGRVLAEEAGWEPVWVVHLALRQLDNGDTLSSRDWLEYWTTDSIMLNYSPWPVELLRGELFIAEGKYPEAIKSLNLAQRLSSTDNGIIGEALGRAYLANGQLEDASGSFKDVIDLYSIGSESQEPWIMAHYRMGIVMEEMGKFNEARDYYNKFLRLWESGDEGLEGVDDARERLAGLPAPEQ